jgi:hypothetical protein
LFEERDMANVVKTSWFGNRVSVLMTNGKTVTGELTETSDNYIILSRDGAEVQVMVQAIVMVVPAADKGAPAAGAADAEEEGPALFE